jgi:trk system potassium uptake protein
MKVVILGCGRLGSRIAAKMIKEGHSVIAVDKDPAALSSLGKEFAGKVMQGDGTDMAIYEGVLAEKTDIFLSLTNSDNTNIMAAEIASQKYKAGKAIARVSDPVRAKAFEELGIETFCPTVLSEKKIGRMISGSKVKESGDE